MALAVVNELVHDHAVKALLGWGSQQPLRQSDMLLPGKTKTVNEPPRLLVGRLDAPADLHFLLAREQRHPPHLPQIHPHRIIQTVLARRLFLVASLGSLASVQ